MNAEFLKLVKFSPKHTVKAAVIAAALVTGYAVATPININAQLTGDVRQAGGLNPENIIIDVTITSDTTSNVASFLFDINSPTHPDIKLDEFYFNVTGVATDYTFANFTPSDWNFAAPATVQGAGGTTFMFEVLDPAGPPNAADVTNSQNLSFDLMLVTGNFTEEIFLNAITSVSNDAGSGQLGAHLQSLTTSTVNCPNGCNTDSGFAFGNYSSSSSTSSTGGGTGSSAIPEPGSVSLFGIAMLGGLLVWRRRRVGS